MNINVDRYIASDRDEWNRFNCVAKNGHFLFDRGFMEYHSDRFTDFSLVFRDGGELIGILSANRSGDTLYTHQGLTFGGLVTDTVRTPTIMAMLDAAVEYLRASDCCRIVYKAMPRIYHRRPADEDLFWLHREGAQLIRRDISSAIRHADTGRLSSRRKRGAAKAEKSGLIVKEADSDWAGFWTILTKNLTERHEVAPVHSLEEIRRLAADFPSNIKLCTARTHDGEPLAGVVLFVTPMVVHAQYIASNERGRECGALDFLFQHVIEQSRLAGHLYFDFGISTEDQGKTLNTGLIAYKEEFGASGTIHDFYELRI